MFKSEASLHHHLALLYLIVTINRQLRQGATSFPSQSQTVQWKQHTILGLLTHKATELCTWRKKSWQRSCLVLTLKSMFLSGGNTASAIIFFLCYSTSPKGSKSSTDAAVKEHCISRFLYFNTSYEIFPKAVCKCHWIVQVFVTTGICFSHFFKYIFSSVVIMGVQ